MSYHQFQMFEKIGTEESQIETSIELSETVNLFIKQNTYDTDTDTDTDNSLF